MRSMSKQDAILGVIRENGPSRAGEIAEVICNRYKRGMTVREVTNYIKILKGHGLIRVIEDDGHSCIYGIVSPEPQGVIACTKL